MLPIYGVTKKEDTTFTKIMGNAVARVEQMTAYIKAKNPDVAQSVVDMIPLYLSEGKAEGIRGDIAYAQSCLETGNFGFSGSAVTLDQNNFCGMGVTSNGMKGNSFDTPQLGIRAQIQHLKAYASTEDLKNECIDPRFKYVARGCAEYVEWLGQKENPVGKGWAAGAGYGAKIITILNAMIGIKSEVAEPEEVWYRVRKTWADAVTQKGAFHSLENAKKCADENKGYGKQKWDLQIFFEEASGTDPNRKEFNRLKAEIAAKKIDVVVTMRAATIARNWEQFMEFMLICSKRNVEVVCIDKVEDAHAIFRRIQEFKKRFFEGSDVTCE